MTTVGAEYMESSALKKHGSWQAMLIHLIAGTVETSPDPVTKFIETAMSKPSSCTSKRSVRQLLGKLKNNSEEDTASLWEHVLKTVKSSGVDVADKLLGTSHAGNCIISTYI